MGNEFFYMKISHDLIICIFFSIDSFVGIKLSFTFLEPIWLYYSMEKQKKKKHIPI